MIEELAATPRLLVGSDFDGTLAEIVDDPDLATPLARSLSALEGLADLESTTVAIISGRVRSQLVERFDHPSFVLIGEHGADRGDGAGAASSDLARARDLAEAVAATTPGAWVEEKARSVGFHYRNVAEPDEAVAELRHRVKELDGVRTIEGKSIIELTDSHLDKGSALLELKSSLRADRVLFMGDDVTDETAFAVLATDDVGIHVGVGPSLASVTIPDPSTLADFLDTLLARRREVLQPT